MLEARSIAVVGASDREGSFGRRLTTEALRSPGVENVHLVNPRRREVFGRPCVSSLEKVLEPVDLVLCGVPDSALPGQVTIAASRGDAGAVVYGTASGLAAQLQRAAGDMALCGAGCMGFVNVARGVRAIGYLERHPMPVGPIAMVTHSGSAFSALLRTHRRLEFSFIVSSGQELVTTTADYLDYALGLDETRVVGLLLETMRDVPRLREALASAAERDIPVVALTVGGSPTGRDLVDAHSGAIAGDDAAWEALFAAYGVHRATDLSELSDSLEVFAIGRRVRRGSAGGGFASLHDSGAERVLVADLADALGVPFASLAAGTVGRLQYRLEPGLVATNPLDVWGTGADSEALFTDCLDALAHDPSVDVVALAVDLVPEYDGDTAMLGAVESAIDRTDKPVLVLSNLPSAVDQAAANRLRARGVPVLEGTRSGLRAIGHLLAHATPPRPLTAGAIDAGRRARWADRLARGPIPDWLDLVADYGIPVVTRRQASSCAEALGAAAAIGYPVVLKTAAAGLSHKLDVDGVRLDLTDPDGVRTAYEDLAERLGHDVVVQRYVAPGVEIALGVVRDPLLGPLVIVASGGSLVELLSQRSVALPSVDRASAEAMIDRLPSSRLLRGHRGRSACDVDAVVEALLAMSQLAGELGDHVEALDVNPLIVSSRGAVAVDALVTPLQSPTSQPT
uniref:Acetyl-CoA synthetase n=1 Tax=uncultured Nocardioidaceae bacterium TaxID=253824 RepID=A0A6J4MLZ8_9ACTN|nr:MAG: Acetyl-CoA synthetase [uncultured Nocardioidaceae bacterium]